jgi:hypothetical protein
VEKMEEKLGVETVCRVKGKNTRQYGGPLLCVLKKTREIPPCAGNFRKEEIVRMGKRRQHGPNSFPCVR